MSRVHFHFILLKLHSILHNVELKLFFGKKNDVCACVCVHKQKFKGIITTLWSQVQYTVSTKKYLLLKMPCVDIHYGQWKLSKGLSKAEKHI